MSDCRDFSSIVLRKNMLIYVPFQKEVKVNFKRMTSDKSRARYNCAKKFHSEELSTKAPSNHSIPVSVV